MMQKRLQDFLQNPSTMAYAGYWAMVPKAGMGLLIGVVFSLLVGKNLCLGLMYITYPIIALIVDVVLYRFKDKLWELLPSNKILPKEWNITTTELVQYAKQLPKIRLLRLRFIPVLGLSFYVLFVLIGDEDIDPELFTLGMLCSSTHLCFFLSVLFEPTLCKKQGLKTPNRVQIQPGQTNHHHSILDATDHAWIIHPYHTEAGSTLSRCNDWGSIHHINQHNPHIPGTSAWILAQHQNTAYRSSMMELDRMTSMEHTTHPANSWHSSIHNDYHSHFNTNNLYADPLPNMNNNHYTSNSFDSSSYASTINNYNHSNHLTHNTTDYSSSMSSNSNWNSFTSTTSPTTNPFSSSSGFGF